jgi:uncharacterized protein YpbB
VGLLHVSLSQYKSVKSVITIGGVNHSTVKMEYAVLVPLMINALTKELAVPQENVKLLNAHMKSFKHSNARVIKYAIMSKTNLFATITFAPTSMTVGTIYVILTIIPVFNASTIQIARVGSLVQAMALAMKSFNVKLGLTAKQTYVLLRKTVLLMAIATRVSLKTRTALTLI